MSHYLARDLNLYSISKIVNQSANRASKITNEKKRKV